MPTRMSLLRELVIVDRGGSLILRLAHGAAYHTSMAMNQNIVQCTQHCTRHAQGKADLQTCVQGAVQLKKHAAGGYVPGEGWKLPVAGGQNDRQGEWKANGTTNFLTAM